MYGRSSGSGVSGDTPNKGHKEGLAQRYWHTVGTRKWVFWTKENVLQLFSDAKIRRHVMPKLNANPYLDRNHLFNRRERIKWQTPWLQTKLSFFALPPKNRVVERMSGALR